jgi:hypothetical protein
VSSSSGSSGSDAKSVSSQHVAADPFGFSKYALTVTPTKIIALDVASKLAVAWTKLLPAKGQRSVTKVSATELLVVDVETETFEYVNAQSGEVTVQAMGRL